MDELDQIIHESIKDTAKASETTTDDSNKRIATEKDDSEAKRPKPSLDLDIEMAIERANEPDHHDQTQSKSTENDPASKDDESDLLRDKGTVIHDGVAIPADSELLKPNSAYSTYSELSSQVSSLPTSKSNLAALPLAISASDYLPPKTQLLVNTLPSLDNLATQILRTFAAGSYLTIIELVSNLETPQGATFRDLTSLFEFTKKLYSEEDPFLSVRHVSTGIWKENEATPVFFKNKEQSIEATLRKTNLATFLLATLGVIEVGFYYLNESFLNIFCPLNSLDPDSSLSNGSGQKSLSSDNVLGDKIGKLFKPQAALYLDLKTQAYISAIEAEEKSRVEVLDEILPENLDEILMTKRNVKQLTPVEQEFIERCKSRRKALLNYHDNSLLSEEYEWFQFLKSLFDYVNKNIVFLIWGTKKFTKTPASPAKKYEKASDDQRDTKITESTDISDSLLPSEIIQKQLHVSVLAHGPSRLSTRRPWSREEENALRQGLEMKGPHWSKILELFGAGGKISEALKHRTQVQLKDKARNWKIFFLKSGLPVPQYLQKVTGDLEREDRRFRSRRTAAAPIPDLPKK